MNSTTQLQKHLSQLFLQSLQISNNLYQLELIRTKIHERGYQSFDKGDILSEFGQLQARLEAINHEMLRIHNLLNQPR